MKSILDNFYLILTYRILNIAQKSQPTTPTRDVEKYSPDHVHSDLHLM